MDIVAIIKYQNHHGYYDFFSHQNRHLSFWNQIGYLMQGIYFRVASKTPSTLILSLRMLIVTSFLKCFYSSLT